MWQTLKSRFFPLRADARLRALVRPDHFRQITDQAEARRLFKSSVGAVEIETFSYCNRTCSFCPNAEIDRRSERRHMDEALYLSILEDLAAIDYDGIISYSRYNEPLADAIILTRLRQARAALPTARLTTHSNGDFLTRDLLDALYDAGLRALHLQAYPAAGEPFDDWRTLTRMRRMARALKLPYLWTGFRPGIRYGIRVLYRDMHLTISGINFGRVGVNRGGLVAAGPAVTRRSPCLVPFHSVYVDWNGSMVPCCNIRSDAPAHRDAVVARLGRDMGLIQAYAAGELVAWRRALLPWGPKSPPCAGCDFALLPDLPPVRDVCAGIARTNGLEPA